MLATPIGNLQDISLRALQQLREAALIAAEDTRVARRLLAALAVVTAAPIVSLRAHNERRAAQTVIRALQEGGQVVYLSDAGTPGVSDPGARLARAVRAAGFAVSPVPGASALTALLSVAGAGGGAKESAVHFYGFPPAAARQRQRFFKSLCALDGVSVFYEAPHRIAASMEDLQAAFGAAQRVVLGRELTKLHEQVVEGTLAEVAAMLKQGGIPARGEFALAVDNPAQAGSAVEGWRVFCELAAMLPPRKAAAIAAKVSGGRAAALYQRHLAERREK